RKTLVSLRANEAFFEHDHESSDGSARSPLSPSGCDVGFRVHAPRRGCPNPHEDGRQPSGDPRLGWNTFEPSVARWLLSVRTEHFAARAGAAGWRAVALIPGHRVNLCLGDDPI